MKHGQHEHIYDLGQRVTWWGKPGSVVGLSTEPDVTIQFDDGEKLSVGQSTVELAPEPRVHGTLQQAAHVRNVLDASGYRKTELGRLMGNLLDRILNSTSNVTRDALARFLEDYLHGTDAPLDCPCTEHVTLAEAIMDDFTVTTSMDSEMK